MSIGLAEAAVDQVLDYLEANLATHIAAVNAQYGDAITITTPHTFETAELEEGFESPALMVVADESVRADVVNEQVVFATRQALTIIVADEDQDRQTLRRRLYRHVLAVVNCLRAGEVAVAFSFYWRTPYAQYTPIYVSPTSMFAADAQVYIDVALQEAV